MTVKSTGFTCVPFSSVASLYFWQSGMVKSAKLVFTTSQNCVKSTREKRTQTKPVLSPVAKDLPHAANGKDPVLNSTPTSLSSFSFYPTHATSGCV